MINLFDTYHQESHDLHASLQDAGYTHPTIVLNDDGFLPEEVDSPYRFFMREFEADNPVRPRFFNEVDKPELMEIKGTNSKAEIYDYDQLVAAIYYSEPEHKRLVKRVDWYDRSKQVRRVDCYNIFGRLYAEIIFDNQQRKAMTRYFDIEDKEVIVENHLTKDIILTEDGKVRIFQTKKDFVLYYLKQADYDLDRIFYNSLGLPLLIANDIGGEGSDILFWTETIQDAIPGNMTWLLNTESTRNTEIVIMNNDTYLQILSLTSDKNHDKLSVLGYTYQFKKENKSQRQALVFTNSDQLHSVRNLVTSLPDVQFHVAALTEMSSKLMAFDRYTNVHLYPNIKHENIEELLLQADIYLDINFGQEILFATRQAFEYNLLLLGFDNTLHTKTYMAPTHIFPGSDPQGMIECVKLVLNSKEAMLKALNEQHATANTVSVADYHKVIG